MTKILFLTPYPLNSAPSQRFRFEQYLQFLQNENIKYELTSFLDEKTWTVFYKKGFTFQKILGILKGILKRHFILFSLHKYDKLFIHREACLVGPAYFEWLYARVFRKEVIYDFDDAIWIKDVSDVNKKLSWLKFPNKTGKIITYSTTVIAGNNYLANYALQFNINVKVIPTTIDVTYHYPHKIVRQNEKIRIGWTGTITTNNHLKLLFSVLVKLKKKYPQVELVMISNTNIADPSIEISYQQWNKNTEIEDLSRFDIGIMPLPDDEWAKGKCGFKGLQYMALEIPTIMSPVGVNTEIIEDGKNGFLATSDTDWIEKLSRLIETKELREKIGRAGRKTVVENYSIESQKEAFFKIIQE
ncbi:MAG: glycosyltransferase family 4 protein [Vicingaceae bacterium]|nr:glycosyltransferase family 4 protein [Vicingaceae bacterium]